MNLGMMINIASFLTLLYFAIQFFKTRNFIYKLPRITRSKYIGLEILSRRVLLVNIILFVLSLFVNNIMGKAVLMIIVGFIVTYAISELNILKEYVNKKKSGNK